MKLLILRSVAICLSLAAQAPAIEPQSSHEIEKRPNAVAHASLNVLQHFLKMQVERTLQLSDNVLGTAVRGQVHTTGDVVPVLVPSKNQGRIDIRLQGTVNSPRMIGRNGPATIYSSSTSLLDVRKPIILNHRGIELLPAEAQVQTQLRIHDVTAARRLVERIATRRAMRSRDAARAVTTQKTKSRIQTELDRDAAKPLSQGQDYFDRGFRNPLLARGALPKLFEFSSTTDFLRLAVRQCSQSEQPAPTWVPRLNTAHDLSIAFHETSIESLYEIFFSGETAFDRDVLHTVHLLTGEDPRPLRVHERTPRWSITFDKTHPLELDFSDCAAKITLHLTRLQFGDEVYESKFVISTHYHLEITPHGPQLTQRSPLIVTGEPVADDDFEKALDILRKKFTAVFPPVLVFDGLVPPTGGVWDKVRQLNLAQLDAQSGWLIIGYQLIQPPLVAQKAP